MNYKKSAFVLLLFLQLHFFVGKAATFTVVSNADSGPGTLRNALTQAAAAGGASGINYIYFNLPGSGAASHTIMVNSVLPVITSSLIIDGTTQPGAALSVNGAKVIVQGIGQWSASTNCFEVHDAADFEIYGMVVKEFYTTASAGAFSGGSALALLGTSAKVIIGGINKGNVFYDNGTGILNFTAVAQPVQSNIAYCEIKNNYLGVKENGLDFSVDIQSAVILSYVHQAVIGGATPVEGNIIAGSVSCSPYYDGVNLTIQNNSFGPNINNQTQGVSSDAEQVYFNSNAPTNALLSQINVINNVFATTVTVTNFSNLNFTLQTNYFGTSAAGNKYPIDGPAVSISNVQGTLLIGGADISLGNVFTNAVQAAKYQANNAPVVSAQSSGTVELSHNSVYCSNGSPFVYVDAAYNNKPMQAAINTLSTTTATGTSKPGARVELYYTDKECTNCQPKTYIGEVNADAGGNWVYNTSFLPGYGVMVGGTLNKVSSEFTDPRLYEGNIKVQDITCSQAGGITGAVVVNGASITWIGPNGPISGNGPQLVNAAPGTYILQVNQFGCIKSSVSYTIKDDRPVVNDNAITVTRATCTSNNGSITGLVPNSNVASAQWLDAGGNIVGTNIDLTNAPPGVYTLQLIGAVCTNIYGPVTIGSTANVIIITPGSEQNTPDQCGLGAGGIKGIQVSGGMPPYKYAWVNSAGQTVGTNPDISNLRSGTYTLSVTDNIPCDAASATYTIGGVSAIIDAPLVNNVKVCGNEAILRVNNPDAGYSYRLYNNATDILPVDEQASGIFDIKLKGNINYYYVSKLTGSCESQRVKVEADFSTEGFSVNNTITPNGDGINDYWDIKGLDAYPAATVKIFNRSGQIIFQSIGYPKPFDGNYNGKQLPSGTYYYIIDIGSACSLLSGSLTIIR